MARSPIEMAERWHLNGFNLPRRRYRIRRKAVGHILIAVDIEHIARRRAGGTWPRRRAKMDQWRATIEAVVLSFPQD